MQILKKESHLKIKSKIIKPKKYAFRENLEEAELEQGVEAVGESAFYDCNNLKAVLLPESLKVLSEDAFALCKKLVSVSLPGSLEEIGERCFSWSGIKDITIPEKISVIPDSAFSNCRSLEAVKIEKGCCEIAKYAFFNCFSLKEIVIPDSVKALGKETFKGCCELKSVVLSGNIKVLEKNLFENCRDLEAIKLPDSLEIIEDECFSGCVNLKSIILPEALKAIGKKAFYRCESLETIVFPESLESLGERAFDACYSLKGVKLNDGLKQVGACIFINKVSEAPDSIREMHCTSFLEKEACNRCPTITIPEGVTQLHSGYKGLLPYTFLTKGKTCYNHILALKKYRAKVFISENYNYGDNDDIIIKNGYFDFPQYDMFFEKAEENEKPLIAAFRLAYPTELSSESRRIYELEAEKNGKAAAVFAVEINEEKVLEHLINTVHFENDFCNSLYSSASKKGLSNLIRILSFKNKKTEFDEIYSLYEELTL